MNQRRRDFLRSTLQTGLGCFAAGLGLSGCRPATQGPAPNAPAGSTPGQAGHAPQASVSVETLAPVTAGNLLILGGTGFLGPHTVRAALPNGHQVTLFNRGKTNPHLFPELKKLRGDRRKGDLAALEDPALRFDAVIDTSGYVPRNVRKTAQLLADRGGQYIFVSSISAYKDGSVPGINEQSEVGSIDPKLAESITDRQGIMEHYGPLKAMCEAEAEAAFPGRCTVIRPGLIVGPGDPTDRYTYWPVRLARGGEVLAPGNPSDPVQIIDGRDLGSWIVTTIEQRHLGVYNACGPEQTLTVQAMLEACKPAAGTDARLTWVEHPFLEKQGVMPWMHMPVWVPPGSENGGFGSVDNRRAIAAGLTFRPAKQIAADTLKWFRERPEEDQKHLLEGKSVGISQARDAEVLAAWHEHQKQHTKATG